LVEDRIQPSALCALNCWFPEFHTSILFEYVFDDKLFSQQNKEKLHPKPARNRRTQPTLLHHSPGLILHPRPAPGGCLCGVARSWGQGWP
jgi:hypothetical protein